MAVESVMIVEDDPVALELMTTIMQGKGFKTLAAVDANQAFTLAIRQRPGVILLDIKIPGGTGISVLERLKTSDKTCDIPVIVVSGLPDPDLPEQVMTLGAKAFVAKPIDPEALQRLVAALFREGGDQEPVKPNSA